MIPNTLVIMICIWIGVLLVASVGSSNGTSIPSSHTFTPTRTSWKSLNTAEWKTEASKDQPSNSQSCFPKSWDMLFQQGLMKQANNCSSVQVLSCYCLTSDSESNSSYNRDGLMFGNCFYGCFNYDILTVYYEVNLIDQQWENATCSFFNRKGLLCGQCKAGYAPAAYSFHLKCVKCESDNYWTRLILYVFVAYGPLTIFLTFIVFFTVSVNSAPLRGWIFVCQLTSTSIIMRLMTGLVENYDDTCWRAPFHILGSVYGVWNLDFFRIVYKPFCLYPKLTTLQVMSLDYIIAAYPLIVIAVTYVLVNLHSCGWKPIVLIWKPFRYCFTRFRHRFQIRTSLIDAFGTFFTLSYVKFLSTSVDLVSATRVWDYNGQVLHRLYYDGTMEQFKGRDIPYVIIAVLVTLLFNILPLVLMLLYSFRRTSSLLNYLSSGVQLTLFPFMDNILGCYKDGTNGTQNCRYFGVLHHVALMVIFVIFLWVKSIFLIGVMAAICIVMGMLVAVIQPYKSKAHNIASTVLILSLGVGYAGGMLYFIANITDPVYLVGGGVIAIPPFFFPLFYIVGYIGLKVLTRSKETLFILLAKVRHFLHCTLLMRIIRGQSTRQDLSEYSVLVQ